MLKTIFIAILFCTAACDHACEPDSISTCGRTCEGKGRTMDSYSVSNGCKCIDTDKRE